MARPFNINLSNLNPREQRLVTAFGIVLGALLVLGLPALLQFMVITRRSDNEASREAISAIQTARSSLRERQSRRESILQRYASKAPPLAGLIEQTARVQKIEVTDSQDRQAVPTKKYTERNTVAHFKKTGMLALSKFIETIESKGHALRVTRLNVRKRAAEQDSYDVEVGVSAWDRNEGADKNDKATEKKP